MANTVDKVINEALKWEGYLEKKSNSNLESKTGNAGSNNYTIFWAKLAPGMNGAAWCNTYTNFVFQEAYGEKTAKKLLCTDGVWSYYTPTSASYFKNKKQWYTSNPQVGDVIYFKNTQRICHVGLVIGVDSKKVYTIEGNTSAGASVIPNGGAVCKKQYLLTNSKIAGYGRPKYDVSKVSSTTVNNSITQVAKDVIAGKYGTGAARKQKLEAAGYNYSLVQAEVNKLLKG